MKPVRFFGGPPPSEALLAIAGPGAIVRVRPDLLDPEKHWGLFFVDRTPKQVFRNETTR